ncbi:hypothetical protein BH23VER1_BH23VER1_19030 [soil metagenome]
MVCYFDTSVLLKALTKTPVRFETILWSISTLATQIVPSTGCRTLDIIHIGICLHLGLDNFVTLDHRQAATARVAGLRVIDREMILAGADS